MKNWLHILFLAFSFVFINDSLSQMKDAKKLSELASEFESKGNLENAIYYLKLSSKSLSSDKSSIGMSYKLNIESKIKILSKKHAYSSLDSTYLWHLKSADSLLTLNQYLQSLFKYEKAYEQVKSYNYPIEQINTIKKKHPEVLKKIAVFNASQKRLEYKKEFKNAIELDKEGYYLEAYYRFKGLKKKGHIDPDLNEQIENSMQYHGSLIAQFEKKQYQAEEQYLIKIYERSIELYEEALKMNSECNICVQRLNDLPHILKNENTTELKFIEVISLDEQVENSNLKLSLEKANKLYDSEKYIEALNVYLRINETYSLEGNRVSFVEKRIKDCKKGMNK